VQKFGGTLRHQALEKRWVLALSGWHGNRSVSCHEWQHEFRAPGYAFAILVPDIAYQSRSTLDELGPAASEAPARAPEFAVEILCAAEPEHDLAWKIGAYLAGGTHVLFVVDPPRRTVIAYARPATGSEPSSAARFGPGETVTHALMPGFAYPIDAMFEGLYLGD
jgi:Uma2 family endonuclease